MGSVQYSAAASRWCGSRGWWRAGSPSDHEAAGGGWGAGVHVAAAVEVVVDLGGGADHAAVEEDGEGRGLEVAFAQPASLVVGPEQPSSSAAITASTLTQKT